MRFGLSCPYDGLNMGRLTRKYRIEFVRPSGPGGQRKNRKATGVRLTHVATGVIVTATERRLQSQNLAVAQRRMELRLKSMACVKKSRVATNPTASSRRRTLESKRARSETKSLRRKVDTEAT